MPVTVVDEYYVAPPVASIDASSPVAHAVTLLGNPDAFGTKGIMPHDELASSPTPVVRKKRHVSGAPAVITTSIHHMAPIHTSMSPRISRRMGV